MLKSTVAGVKILSLEIKCPLVIRCFGEREDPSLLEGAKSFSGGIRFSEP